MANHRTLMELKPYEGCTIERLTVNGKHTYTAYDDRKRIKCTATTLRGLKQNVHRIHKQEKAMAQFLGRRLLGVMK